MSEMMTYWSACIACLPAEKRAAAERAFAEIAAGGEDGMWPKVFLLMEAHGLYVHSIPETITAAGEQAANLVRQAAVTNGALSKEDKEELLKAIDEVASRQSAPDLSGITSAVKETNQAVKELKEKGRQARTFRVGVALFLMGLTMVCTIQFVWLMNREVLQALWAIRDNGLILRTERLGNTLRVRMQGPVEQTVPLKENNGDIAGVLTDFSVKSRGE
jgi:hypothetical protein